MANIKELVAFICRWEGGYTNDPSDSGGPTNRGVTLVTWQNTGYDKNNDGFIDEQDVARITHEEMVEVVLRPHYWNVWQADKIHNQAIANLLVDWLWTSGRKTIFTVQQILEVKADGIVGKQTLHALNNFPDQSLLFDRIKTTRINDIHLICKKYPKNLRFKRGWLNRIASIKFLPVMMLFIMCSNLISCKTTGRHSSQMLTNKTENNAVSQEASAIHHQTLSTNFNQLATSLCIDSTTETAIIAFKLLSEGDSAKPQIPIQAEGKAIFTRNKKVLTTAQQSNQEAKDEATQDSSLVKSAVETSAQDQSAQDQSAYRQPATTTSRTKTELRVLIIILLALWFYSVFLGRKSN